MYTHFLLRLSSLFSKKSLRFLHKLLFFLLFNFQGPIKPLSRRQLFNYITHISVCQQLFYLFYKFFQTSLCILLPLRDSLFIIPHSFSLSTSFLIFFKKVFRLFSVCSCAPQSAHVLYTLSLLLSITFWHLRHYIQKGCSCIPFTPVNMYSSILYPYRKPYCFYL